VQYARIARPTDRLDDVVRFYREGLGLPELDRFAGHASYRGVLLGLPGMRYHLEFTHHDHCSPGRAPSRENLLVLYLGNLAQVRRIASRLAAHGHLPVEVLERARRGHRRGSGRLAGRPDAAAAGAPGRRRAGGPARRARRPSCRFRCLPTRLAVQCG
jgi:catechol 2,3-dioxygenase-like lactoylglutathione lyase family enzyme